MPTRSRPWAEAPRSKPPGKRAEAAKHADEALSLLRGGLEAYVRVARNRTDLGAIAVMNEFGYRRCNANGPNWAIEEAAG